jgi:hypothetical protein
MLQELLAAGFVGVEQGSDGVIYARINAATPEFTLQPAGKQWRFSIEWPLRASEDQRRIWVARHPDAPLDVDLGETRMQFLGESADLPHWAHLVEDMVQTCVSWRRITRQGDEGM